MDGGPPRFGPGFTCPALLRDRVAPSGLGSRTGLSPAAAGPPMPFRSPAGPAPGGGSPRMRGPATPTAEPLPGTPARRFGHRSPFARRYSGSLEIDFLSSGYLDVSVPRVVRPRRMCSGGGCLGIAPGGFPHSEIRGSRALCASPRLIAACHVLLRLPMPRHPPCALDIFIARRLGGAVPLSRVSIILFAIVIANHPQTFS